MWNLSCSEICWSFYRMNIFFFPKHYNVVNPRGLIWVLSQQELSQDSAVYPLHAAWVPWYLVEQVSWVYGQSVDYVDITIFIAIFTGVHIRVLWLSIVIVYLSFFYFFFVFSSNHCEISSAASALQKIAYKTPLVNQPLVPFPYRISLKLKSKPFRLI